MKVLFADDDVVLHRVLGHRLSREGFTLQSAYNGREALELAEREAPDLLILDGMMPELDGFAVLQEWKRRPGLASIPVIMLTARNREGNVIGALEQGAVDYLTKPFSPAELIARIRRFIQPQSPSSP